jgi:hypothetical protein
MNLLVNPPDMNALRQERPMANSLNGLPDTSILANEQRNQDEEYNKLFDYSTARTHLKRLVDDWKEEITETEERRKTRDVHVNVEELRQRGDIDEDETLVPIRLIDTNIQRELPPYINYLKNSRRLCTFDSLDNPDTDTQNLELAFTRGMTYLSWEVPHYKCLDGAMTHGWDAIEVVLDESKPLHVSHEHIGHDQLFFPRTNRDIQQAPKVIRAYDITILQLKNFVEKFGFDKEQVDHIIASRKDSKKEIEVVRVYKMFCKYQGIVHVGWFALEEASTVADWLKKPAPLSLGIAEQTTEMQTVMVTQPHPLTGQPIQVPTQQSKMVWKDKPVRQYPIFVLPYRETEKPKLTDHKGRCFLDEAKQEAQTAILSSYINGLTRASNLYASVGAEDGSGSSLKELNDTKLVGGRIFNKPLNFFHTDYPDPSVLRFMQYADVANSQETNQPNFAAMNREDSRKTAREIDTANQQQQLLNSVQLTLFSAHIRAVYSFSWLIVQSQAMQGLIAFLRITKQRPSVNPMQPGQPIVDPQTGQPAMESYQENDFDTIKQSFDVRAAGDIDVVQRQERVSQMMADWPVVANTPLAGRFLQDLVRLKYPDKGEEYAGILGEADQLKQMQGMVAQLGTMLQGAVKEAPQVLQGLQPQEQQALMQAIQQSQQVAAQLQTPPSK